MTTKYNGMDTHFYTDRTEIHLGLPAFKVGQRVKLTEKGVKVQAERGKIVVLDEILFVTNVVVSVTVNMGRKEEDSNMDGGRWHYGINRSMDAEAAGWGMSAEFDEIEAVDQGGTFTIGVVIEDTVNAGESVLENVFEPWVDCDNCGGHAVGGIGMMCCPDCDCEGTADNGMSCITCDGSGAVICPYCNKED